jgi:hypothetical protein
VPSPNKYIVGWFTGSPGLQQLDHVQYRPKTGCPRPLIVPVQGPWGHRRRRARTRGLARRRRRRIGGHWALPATDWWRCVHSSLVACACRTLSSDPAKAKGRGGEERTDRRREAVRVAACRRLHSFF